MLVSGRVDTIKVSKPFYIPSQVCSMYSQKGTMAALIISWETVGRQRYVPGVFSDTALWQLCPCKVSAGRRPVDLVEGLDAKTGR